MKSIKSRLSDFTETPSNIDGLLDQGGNNLFRIDKTYVNGNTDQKRAVIGSMFPENLIIDGFVFQTARVNEVARFIYSLGEAFIENKTGQKCEIAPLSCIVTLQGFKP